MGNRTSKKKQKKNLLVEFDASDINNKSLLANFYKTQLIEIAEEIAIELKQKKIPQKRFEAWNSVLDFHFRELICFSAPIDFQKSNCQAVWEILEEKYVDLKGNKLFPLYYSLNTPLKKESMINLAITHNLSSLILKMVEEHPQEMVQVYNSNKTSSMLHDLASIDTLFTQDEIKLAEWLIRHTDKFSRNIFGQTFLETAVINNSPNFDFLAKLAYKNTKWLIICVLEKSSLRKNLYRNVLKYCKTEKLIRKSYYNMTKKHCLSNQFSSWSMSQFKGTESLLAYHTQF
ncbi:unnamed protein product [Moneuplotes crassus]|uniref:Uncharacterized protein n=1 Tax=Euplotes crassus TaxID=5936 RepID=A0AAD1XM72_EUPCR|nr:unnamed protein product [Moneuplotes crassus]